MTLFSVLLTWGDVVLVVRVLIVGTGISLMELDWDSLMISLCIAELRLFTYVVETMLTHQLVSIAVIFQLMLSMMILTSQLETQSMWDCILPVEVCFLLSCIIHQL